MGSHRVKKSNSDGDNNVADRTSCWLVLIPTSFGWRGPLDQIESDTAFLQRAVFFILQKLSTITGRIAVHKHLSNTPIMRA